MTAPQRGGPPKKVMAPASARATATTLTTAESTEHRREDGYAAPDAESRYESWLLAEAERRGYRLSCKCLDCSRPLTDKISVRYHRGPVCRARAGVVA